MTEQDKKSKGLEQPLVEQSFALTDSHHEQNEREQFNDYFSYILAVVGFAAGYGSFWRFPSLIYQHGGGAFLIPYTIIMIVLGIPLLYLETIVGQMFQTTIPKMFQRVNQGFRMFGYIIILITLGISIYYNVLLTYSYRYIFVSFETPLPFEKQLPTSNEYFRDHILHRSQSIHEFGTIHWELALLFLISLYICYEVIRRGIQAAGKVLVITVIAPYIFLILLIIRAIPLEGSFEGLEFLFMPTFSKIFTGKIWVDATVQVFFQISIASAGLINFASLKKKHEPFMSAIWLVPLSVIICGLLCGAAIFMYVGHFCQAHNVDIASLTLSGQQLAFSVVPKAIALLPWSNLLLLTFSVILVMLGIDSQFGFLQAIVGAVQQDVKSSKNGIFGFRPKSKHLYLGLILFIGAFFPLFSSSAGIYYLAYFDSFVTDINLPLGALIQLYLFVYIFNFDSLQQQVQKHVGCKTPMIIQWALKSKLLIIMLIGIILLGLINQISSYNKYSVGMYIFGWIITLYPSIIALIYYKLYAQTSSRTTFHEIEEYQKNNKSSKLIQLM